MSAMVETGKRNTGEPLTPGQNFYDQPVFAGVIANVLQEKSSLLTGDIEPQTTTLRRLISLMAIEFVDGILAVADSQPSPLSSLASQMNFERMMPLHPGQLENIFYTMDENDPGFLDRLRPNLFDNNRYACSEVCVALIDAFGEQHSFWPWYVYYMVELDKCYSVFGNKRKYGHPKQTYESWLAGMDRYRGLGKQTDRLGYAKAPWTRPGRSHVATYWTKRSQVKEPEKN